MSDQHLGSDQMEFSVCDGSDVSTRSGEARCSGQCPDRWPQCWLPATGSTQHTLGSVRVLTAGALCGPPAPPSPPAHFSALGHPLLPRPLQSPPEYNPLPRPVARHSPASPKGPPKPPSTLETPQEPELGVKSHPWPSSEAWGPGKQLCSK